MAPRHRFVAVGLCALLAANLGCRLILGIEEPEAASGSDANGTADTTPARECSRIVATMRTPRRGHTATLLTNGHIVVAGGYTPSGRTADVEDYDPVNDSWSPRPPLPSARSHHAAIALDADRILLLGGYESGVTSTTVVYSMPSGTTSTGSMLRPRVTPAGVRLADGRVLVVGGSATSESSELFDPKTLAWTDGPPMARVRKGALFAIVTGDSVLVGGTLTPMIERLAVSTMTWSAGADLPFVPSQIAATGDPANAIVLARLGDGVMSAAALRISDAAWTPIAAPPERFMPESTARIARGLVLWIGGDTFAVLDPSARRWIYSGKLVASHREGSVSAMVDGRALIAGGADTAIVEVFDPACLP
jgi:hypothetical protein